MRILYIMKISWGDESIFDASIHSIEIIDIIVKKILMK